MSLIGVMLKYLYEFPLHTAFMFIGIGVSTIIDLLSTIILTQPDNKNFLLIFGSLYLVETIWNRNILFNSKLIIKKKIKTKFVIDNWKNYEQLSLIDKNKISMYEHREKLNNSADALVLFIDWGLYEFIILIKTIIILCYMSENYTSIILMTISSLAIYFLIFKNEESKFRIRHKAIHKKLLNIKMMINQRLRLLSFGHTKVSDVQDIMYDQVKLAKKSDRGWNHMSKSIDYINISNLLLLIWLHESTNQLKTVLLLSVFNRVSKAVNWVLRFIHSHQRGEDSYTEYLELFEHATFRPLPPQLKFPQKIVITNIDIHIDNIHIRKVANDTINIISGDRILITGPSGSGKTTTLKAIQGLIPGVMLNKNKPENYINEYIELSSELNRVNFSRASIQTLCVQKKNDKFDINLAKKCLEICCIKYWSDQFAIDESFYGKISSGEKSRVIIALLVLYPLIHFNKKVLILDEPERSLDPLLAYKLLSNILQMKECKNKIIYVVSHLENIPNNFFNKSIKIYDGQIKIINSL